jgi:PTS system ascorbate-specific IIA component
MKNQIFIIAHAPLASALRNCVAHVLPEKMQDILVLDVQPGTAPQDSLLQAQKLLDPVVGAPLLVLTDVLGATPCNVARQLVRGRQARIVAGANLPMVLRALTYQEETLDTLVARVLSGGLQGVLEVTKTEDEE